MLSLTKIKYITREDVTRRSRVLWLSQAPHSEPIPTDEEIESLMFFDPLALEQEFYHREYSLK